MITIINYGMGNLRSIEKAFKRLKVETLITDDLEEIKKANKLLLPGVGHFKKGMNNLQEMGLIEVLKQKVLEEKCPILGICLGMQLFTKYSEEGDGEGLSFIDTETVSFPKSVYDKNLKVPHMGWNTLDFTDSESALLRGIDAKSKFYFVHSYYVKPNENTTSTAYYGMDVCASFEKENIFGTQFHPEKSHDEGLQLLKNFSEL